MFESNLLSQINTQSPLPTFVEVEVVSSLNGSLQKAFQFAHALLAEKSNFVAGLLPWTDEIYFTLAGLLERQLLFHADTTFTELLFGLRRGELVGPTAQAPALPAVLWPSTSASRSALLRYLRWWCFGPSPMPSPEERAMTYVNAPSASLLSSSSSAMQIGNGSGKAVSAAEAMSAAAPVGPANDVVGSADPLLSTTLDGVGANADSIGQLNAEELLSANRASYGHLRFAPLSTRKRWISVFLLTLKPYLEKKAAEWYMRQTDTAADAVALRDAYDLRYPTRAALRKLLVKLVYPAYHVGMETANFLFKLLYLLELTPFPSPMFRLFGIALRRSTSEDALAASSPRAQRALTMARVLLLVIFFGFRLLDFTRNGAGASVVTAGDEGMPIPPAPVWRSDVPVPDDGQQVHVGGRSVQLKPVPQPGMCPLCGKRVTNPAVCTGSGVVGCYPCLQDFVRENGVCPVTGKSAALDQIRRVYEG